MHCAKSMKLCRNGIDQDVPVKVFYGIIGKPPNNASGKPSDRLTQIRETSCITMSCLPTHTHNTIIFIVPYKITFYIGFNTIKLDLCMYNMTLDFSIS